VIAADGVNFNGGGHTVDCAGSGTGISIPDRTAVRVTNVTIIKCGTGIDVVGGGSHVFDTNVNVLNNPTCPPSPGGGTPPPRIGLHFTKSSGSHIRSSNISCNRIGIQFDDSSNNIVDSSIINDNIDPAFCGGVLMEGSSTNNVITSSNLLRNGDFAVETLPGADGNTVQSSTLNNTAFFGPNPGVVLDSSKNTVKANSADGNSFGIAVVFGATGNTIASNEALGNTVFDLFDGNPACDSNSWTNNRFATADQTCIH
jgi:parallel beta-helix repeat protein